MANGRGYQEVGVASGWNLWVWLVSVVVRRYIIDILIIIITFPYSTCISSFFSSIIPISLFIFKCFFVLYNYNIAIIAQFTLLVQIKFHHQTCSKLTSTTPLSHTKTAVTLLKRHWYLTRGSLVTRTRARAVDISSTFLIIDIINYNIIRGSRYLNDLEYSLSNVCYIFHKNNINKTKNILKMNKEIGMLLPKKELIQVE